MKTQTKVSRCDPGKSCRVIRKSVAGSENGAARPSFPRGTKKVLVPVDFSARTDRALKYALALTTGGGPKVALFSAVEPILYEMDYGYGPVMRQICDPLAAKSAADRLRAYARRKVPANRLAEIEIGNGDPVVEIARVAREREVDCIIICTRQQPRYAGGTAVSTADQLIHRSPCPVIVLHEE